MAAKKISSTTTTTVPSGRGDPNQPDTQAVGFGTQGQGTQDQTTTSGFTELYNSMYDQAWAELRSLTVNKRRDILKKLYNKGFGSSSEVSPDGLDTADIDRYRKMLMFQFTTNLTTSQVVSGLDKMFPDTRESTSGSASKLTPKADIDRIFGDVMRVQLGRGPKAEELDKFRNAYYGMEKTGEAPTLQSAAEQQIKTANTNESRAQRFSGYMNVFEQMLRGA